MTDQSFAEFVLLLGAAVLIVAIFFRLRIPSSFGYLLVGIVLGPHTAGPIVEPNLFEGWQRPHRLPSSRKSIR